MRWWQQSRVNTKSQIKWLIVLAGAALIILATMSERYEKIHFKNFSGGEGNAITEVEDGYQEGVNIRVNEESGKLELAPGTSISAISATTDLLTNPAYASNEDYMFVVLTDGSMNHLIYRSSDGSTWSLVKTITQVAWPVESAWIVTHGERILVDSGDDSDCYISEDNGGTFTAITRTANLVAYSLQEYSAALDDYLYAPGLGDTLSFAIYRSKDLNTWEKVLEHSDGSLEDGKMFAFQGFMHITDGRRIFRIVNDKLELVHRFNATRYVFPLKVNENHMQFVGYDDRDAKTILKEWDGQEFKTRARLDIAGIGLVPHFTDGKSGWYTIVAPTGSNYLIRWMESGQIFKETGVSSDSNGWRFFNVKGYISGLYINSSDLWKSERVTGYSTSGSLESRIADCKTLIPKMLICRHRPLAASEVVKVYIKKDKEASYSAALITSDVDGATRKTYTFPRGTDAIEFAQIKIELTGPGTTSPKDIDCTLLGIASGIINAK